MSPDTVSQTLSLTSDEAAALAAILSDTLAALREEIYKTEDFDLRQSLKQRETLLNNIQARLTR